MSGYLSSYEAALANHHDIAVEDEAGYAALWSAQVAGRGSQIDHAVQGGLLADRMAWVFVAGYQCALRHTFAELPANGIAAFAVSEDRKGSPPLAGVSASTQAGMLSVSGYKTWVACSATLQHLVIKADRGERAKYYCIDRHAAGLTLTDKHGSFLSEMSQGIAYFDHVEVTTALDASQVAGFGLRETLYIYMAFCAWAGKFASTPDHCVSLITRLSALVDHLPATQAALEELKAVDNAVQALRESLRESMSDSVTTNWTQDQRLIEMYSPGLQKRKL